MIAIRLALALALLATASTQLSKEWHFQSKTLEEFPQGIELRYLFRLPWMFCNSFSSLDRIAESDKVLQAFANGQNDLRRSVSLTEGSFAFILEDSYGKECRFAHDFAPKDWPTSQLVTSTEGIAAMYYVKQAKDNSPASLHEAHQALKAAMVEWESEQLLGTPYWEIMIVETSSENGVWVGVPCHENTDLREMLIYHSRPGIDIDQRTIKEMFSKLG